MDPARSRPRPIYVMQSSSIAARPWQPRLAFVARLLLVLLLVLPLLLTLLLSLQAAAAADPFAGPFNLTGWGAFIGDQATEWLLLRSLGFGLLVGCAASLLAIGPAYLVAVVGGNWRRATVILSLVVLLGDQVTTVMGWSEIGRQLTPWLFGTEAGNRRDLFADLMTLLAEIHRAMPLAIFCQSWAMGRHDPALIEAGLECGAYHSRLLRWVIWPLLRPGLALGFLCGFAISFGAALEPALLNTGAMSWGESLRQALDIDDNWPAAARFTLLGCFVLLTLMAAMAAFLAHSGRQPRQAQHQIERHRAPRRLSLQDTVAILALVALAFLALPLLWMLILSLRYLAGIAITAGPRLFLQAIIDDPHLLPAIIPSLASALIAAFLATLGGAGLAALWRVRLARNAASWRRWTALLLGTLPFIMPSLFLSTAHLAAHLFFATYLPSSLGILAVAMADAIRAMPLAAVILLIHWRRLPADLDETATEFALDADRLRRLVIGPVLRPGWGTALLATVLLSLSDFQLANALSGARPMLDPSLLAGIATQRSPIYLALIGPLLVLTGWACHLILRRLDRRDLIRAPQGNAGGFGLSMNITARKT